MKHIFQHKYRSTPCYLPHVDTNAPKCQPLLHPATCVGRYDFRMSYDYTPEDNLQHCKVCEHTCVKLCETLLTLQRCKSVIFDFKDLRDFWNSIDKYHYK